MAQHGISVQWNLASAAGFRHSLTYSQKRKKRVHGMHFEYDCAGDVYARSSPMTASPSVSAWSRFATVEHVWILLRLPSADHASVDLRSLFYDVFDFLEVCFGLSWLSVALCSPNGFVRSASDPLQGD